ncbi:hypothetical protein [Mycolicibacterium pyrenivorans]|uniref:hypothetical protein n=1 Tax=Mycolicibacterium pyrenivorans TaxID=187102 RepID=UPI0021F30CA7|nr:hypothetical protein [Mycolicibacterium pyrenivorans]MCV7153668.1 hypothetical protein [Mycolicibacterium pyrenivorans]
MRTAVVRVDVDPLALLAPDQLREGMATLGGLAAEHGAEVVDADLAVMPTNRRQVEVLIAGDDPDELKRTAVDWCVTAFGGFGTRPSAGVLTYVSRGTDDDAQGVLAGLGLRGEIERTATENGWDIVRVTLLKSDLRRVPESRVHTALEASLNCEVHIVTV